METWNTLIIIIKTLHPANKRLASFTTESIQLLNLQSSEEEKKCVLPELTASATHAEALEVQEKKYDGYYSSTKTCEMAMSEAVNENYESILYLVDETL